MSLTAEPVEKLLPQDVLIHEELYLESIKQQFSANMHNKDAVISLFHINTIQNRERTSPVGDK